MIQQFFVDFRNFAGNRAVYVGYRFYGLNVGKRFSGDYAVAFFRQIDENEAAERVLREVGQADLHGAVSELFDPLMGFGVLQICRGIHNVIPPILKFFMILFFMILLQNEFCAAVPNYACL